MLRPQFFFPALTALVILSVMLTPQAVPTEGAPNLTTHSTAPQGASALAEIAARLGWRVRRLNKPLSDTLGTDAVYAVLVRDASLTVDEMHTLFGRVRAGASLLIIAGGGTLRDSLHIDARDARAELARARDDTAACPTERRTLRNLVSTLPLFVTGLSWSGPLPSDTVHIASLRRGFRVARDSARRAASPAAIGIPFGRGRIVAISDPRLLTNDVLRVCHWGAGVIAVRALDWLAERDGGAPRRTIVFDEFHQGYGDHPSTTHAVAGWLVGTPSGRTTMEIIIAALILLAVAAPRPVPPLARTTIPRRSPLEHVSALAQAYEQVRATRTATRLLVQGLRRRLTRVTATRRVTDEDYLKSLASRHTSIAPDATRTATAMTHAVPAAELLTIANTIDRIERSIRT
jgi:hypothetical protein